MPIKQLKKKFEKNHYNIDGENVWNFITTQVIPTIIKEMLIKPKDLPFNIKVFSEPANHIKEIEAFAKDEGHNICCILQREKEEKLKKQLKKII